MMKIPKRIFVLLLCFLMMTASAVSAFAAVGAGIGAPGRFEGNQADTEVWLNKEADQLPPPNIVSIQWDQAVRPNTTFSVTAIVEGEPFTKIEWSRSSDGGAYVPLSGVDSVTLTVEGGIPVSGLYRFKLRVENAGGFSETAVQILVADYADEYERKTIAGDNGVSVTGLFHKSTQKLVVQPKSVTEYPELTALVVSDHVPYRAYNVYLVNEVGGKRPYIGTLELALPVADAFEGKMLRVFHGRADGVVETLRGVAAGNRLKVLTDSLSPFLLEVPRGLVYEITVEAVGSGTVTPEGKVYVASGDRAQFICIGDSGYLPKWATFNGSSVPIVNQREVELQNVDRDGRLVITFEKAGMPDGGGSGGGSGGETGDNSGGGSGGGTGENSGGGSGSGAEENSGGGSGSGAEENSGGGSGAAGDDSGSSTVGGEDSKPESGIGAGAGNKPESGDTDGDITGDDAGAAYQITVESGKGGTVSPSGTVTVKHGESKTFYFYPDRGYAVDKIMVNGRQMTVLGNSYTFTTVTGGVSLQVFFKEYNGPLPTVTYTVTATAEKGGSISPEGISTVRYGGDLYVYFAPNTGYRLTAITVDGRTVNGEKGYYHFADVTRNRTIHAEFEESTVPGPGFGKRFEIKAYVNGMGGTVSPEGGIWVNESGSQTIYFYPEEGYEINTVLVNGREVRGCGGSYTLEKITEDMEVSVTYRMTEDCGCGLCSLWNKGCICPWCWLIPLLIVLSVLVILWGIYCEWQKKNRQNQEHEQMAK